MSNFLDYSRCYDLLYSEKDYRAEAEYVARHIRNLSPDATSLMELGCGTGKHARHFASLGYDVRGFDLSADMIEVARQNHAGETGNVTFYVGDVRSLRIEERFDAVYSLFHVMSYQTTNDDIRSAFHTAALHTVSGGVFLFDCWYGPGVLSDPPAVRVKKAQSDKIEVLRIAEPTVFPLENVVQVDYSFRVHDRTTDRETRMTESHRMRYFFVPEIRILLEDTGFEFCSAYDWMRDQEPGSSTWNAMFVARKL